MQDDIRKMVPSQVIALARFSQAALGVLTARLFTLLSLVFAAVGFGWVLWQPDWIRFAGACAFAVLVFWPVSRLEVARREQEKTTEE